MKKIIWDLFGGGQNSVYNSLKKYNLLSMYEVYTFDITKPTRKHHYKIDLSQDNIVEIFKNFPAPDIIVASPLCQSFSCVLNMKGGGTTFWKYDKELNKIVLRSVEEFEKLKSGFTRRLKAETQLFLAKLGQKCINNTIELIKKYKPKFWYIENPKNSLIWKYITLNKKDFWDLNNFF
ncbi:C-5 cytosine-specific DNA methyltransferase [Mycoplasma sp. SG1]|uniref:C-5 cytosine-specific DNA methyltransferase n=1 Tax=Mycoplasma sp. SG1 TaxID=2810348 RepID=UPI002025964A|nr:C-5 cytosine-specific DNA methyltransferase [Mycoplasma sp. SG1]URM52991.1 C-5 cytosine-specific DNA methyltransferase [Mycoplasma sp. SG1]